MHNKVLITAFATTLMSSTAAMSADYDSGVVTELPEQEYTDVEFGSGWYLRGDIGVSLETETDVTFFTTDRFSYSNQRTNSDFSISAGIGQVINKYLRADITVDHLSGGEWSGRAFNPCSGGGTGTCFTNDAAVFDSTGIALNGYVNLGRYGGFSPYVGAGIGVAFLQWASYGSTPVCELDPGETCNLGTHSGGTATETFVGAPTNYTTHDSTNLTYALMAGVDYRIDKNWLVDVNYRYTHISDDVIALGSDNPGLVADTQFNGIDLHEVRAGLRYELW